MTATSREHPRWVRDWGRVLAPAAVVVFVVYTAYQVVRVVSGASLEFDFGQFYQAAGDLGTGRDPYAVYLSCCQGSLVTIFRGYIYPPLLAILARPLAALPEVPAAVVWLTLLDGCLVAAIWAAHRALRPLLSVDARRWLLAGTLLFPPLLENLGFMQVGTPMMLVLVLGAAAFMRPGTTPRAGIMVALGAALRISPGLAGLAFIRRERASLLAIGAAAAGAAFLAGLMALGGPLLGEYLTRVLPGLGRGTAVFDNQAPAGVALRADLFLFGGHAAGLHIAGLVVSAAVVAATLAMSVRPAIGPARRAAIFAAWIAAIPLVSSITWTHHLATELVVFAFLAPSLVTFTRRWWLAVAAYPMLWMHRVLQAGVVIVGIHSAADIGAPGLVLLSAVSMIGMLMLWAACLAALRGPESTLTP